MLKAAAIFVVLASLLPSRLGAENAPAPAESAAAQIVAGQTMVVIPFENASPTPGLEWLGESFPEAFHEQLTSPILYVSSRNERLRAYERQGIPAGIHPSRASLYRLAEQMDVDYAVLGAYGYDGARLTVTAQLLDMRGQKLLPPVVESGPLADLGTVQTALAWDLLHQIRADFSIPKSEYVNRAAPLPLDALEHYVRGILATSAEEKIQHYREATRISPHYTRAWLELGKAYYGQHNYEAALAALGQARLPSSQSVATAGSIAGSPLAGSGIAGSTIARSTITGSTIAGSTPAGSEAAGSSSNSMSGAVTREANFYFGLAAYARGDLAEAESAFEFVAARLPLAEVYNNLGVVAARRGRAPKIAEEYFERAIQNDPSNPDYRFNLAVTVSQSGDHLRAIRELRSELELRPNDADAKMLLGSLTETHSGGVVLSGATTKVPFERIARNYDEDAFREMTTQMGNWAEQRFARSDPRAHARYHVELGEELLGHGFTTEAEAEFEHAAAVDPSNTSALNALAEAYEARGEATEARAQAEASLRVHESAEAYLVLARLDLKENRAEAAAQNINRAMQLEPANSAALDMKRTLAARFAEKAQP